MYITREMVMERHEELKALRQPEERILRDIAKLLRPEDDDFSQVDTTRDGSQPDIFDSTPLYAHSDFVAGVYGQAVNPANRWFELAIADKDLQRWKTVKDWLYASTSVNAASLSPSVSSFYTEAPAWLGDWGAFGVGVMSSEEDMASQRIIDRAHALRNCWLDVDNFGMVNTMHTAEALSGRNIRRDYGDLPGLNDKSRYTVITAVFPNADHQPGKLGPAGMRFLSCRFSPELKDLWRVKGFYEFPYFCPMWDRRASKAWPRGLGHKIRPDAKTLQAFRYDELTGSAFRGNPVKLVGADADILASDVVPGNLLYGGMGEGGRPLVQSLQMGDNPQVLAEQSNQLRAAIKEGFHFSLLQLVNRPQMTATEVMAFDQERLRLLAPALVRLQAHGQTPLIARRFRMLNRAGQLPPPPPELEGHAISIEYVSPLAKQLVVAEGRNLMNWIGAVGEIAQRTGKMEILDNIDVDDAALVLHNAMGAPPSSFIDQKKRDQMREGRGQQQATDVELAREGERVKIAAEASHAAQAQSAAKQRAAA